MTHTIASRIGRLLERQGLLVRNTEHSYLTNTDEDDPIQLLHGASVTYRIAVGPRKGRKVFTLQTLPAIQADECGSNVDGFSLHAGVASKAHEREKLERICRYYILQGRLIRQNSFACLPKSTDRADRCAEAPLSASSTRIMH